MCRSPPAGEAFATRRNGIARKRGSYSEPGRAARTFQPIALYTW